MKPRLRDRLGLRLAFVLLVTLIGVGALQYVLVSGRLQDDLVAAESATHAADARSIERAMRESEGRADALGEATELLVAIQSRPYVTEAVLVDWHGRVVAAAEPDELGDTEDEPQIMQAVRDRRTFDAVDAFEGEGEVDDQSYSYIAPVYARHHNYALEIEQDRIHLAGNVGGVRTRTLVALGLSLLLGLVLFHLLGGRQVDRLYRLALDRARRDGLTDLGNHRAFNEELAAAVASAHRSCAPLALAVFDVDDFKFLNDEHGHRHGDDVLVRVAWLLRAARASDRGFRLGGDEFVLLMPGADAASAVAAISRLLDAARSSLGGATLSAGICAATSPDGDELWEQADRALNEAKRRGGDCVVDAGWINPSKDSAVPMSKVRAVRSIIADADVEVVFQPIWDLDGRYVLSYEALARPRTLHGLDGPGEAFAIADRIGRAHELDAICRAAALDGASALPSGALLFLNVAPGTLAREDFAADALAAEVVAAGLRPRDVVLEITERSEARLDTVVAEMERLAEAGFQLALDDVGAGNAGLEMLRSAAVDYVKIDRSIVQAAPTDPRARAVLHGILVFARGVDAYVIAEGIEAEPLLDFLRSPVVDGTAPSIHGAQGFLLGRPKPLAAQDPSPLAPAPA